MQTAVPLACFLSLIRPPGIQYENAVLQIAPVDKSKCPFVKNSNDVGFLLYTRHNPTVYQDLIIGDDEKLFASNIDFHDKTVFYFHAWMEQPEDGSAVMVREAYMQRGDTNVIMVDARHLEAGPWYFTAAQNTWYIGRFVAQFVDYLVTRGLNLNNTHFVGHSLGAQAAGVAGSTLQSGRVARITGLDPALPLFENLPLLQRLDPTDADFVDVIHTDAGIFGYKAPMGHVDFFPNGGISPQPGCELEVVIPQQLLLNKCDKHKRTQGFYTYYLTSRKIDSKSIAIGYKFERNINIGNIKANARKIDLIADRNKDHNPIKSIAVGYKLEENINTPLGNIKASTRKIDLIADRNKDYNPINNNRVKRSNFDENNSTVIDINNTVKHTEITNADVISQDLIIKTNNSTNFDKVILNDRKMDTDIEKEKVNSKFGIYGKSIPNSQNFDIVKFKNYFNRNAIKKPKSKQQLKLNDLIIKPLRAIRFLTTINNLTKSLRNRKASQTKMTSKLNQIGSKIKHVLKRQKRFVHLFQKSEENNNSFLFKILDFLVKNRKNVLPVLTVMREVNTLIKSANGELTHSSKESNNYIGVTPSIIPVTYNLELGGDSKVTAFVKRLFGLKPKGDSLTISGR